MRRLFLIIPEISSNLAFKAGMCYYKKNIEGGSPMAKLSPSLLAADFTDLAGAVRDFAANGADWVHVDVMDGHFVPNITIGIPVVAALKKRSPLPLDVHLMIQNPLRYVDAFLDAGADILTLHAEADTPDNLHAALDRIARAGAIPALALKPGTPAEAAEPYLSQCGMILVMTVEPGFGGQKFREDMMPKLSALRTRLDAVNPGCLLQVDGGVDTRTHALCKRNGANVLVAGSAYFRAPDRKTFVEMIQNDENPSPSPVFPVP